MTLVELRYILALAKFKHFGQAAKHCHVSQPTLSVAINKLEQELGTQIFERHSKEVRVTEIGEQLLLHARRALAETDEMVKLTTNKNHQLSSPLRVGAIYTIGPYLFPNLIPQLQKIAPEMPLIIEEDYTKHLKEKLREGSLDAIFVALPFSDTNVVAKALYDEPFVVLMRQDHPLAKKESIEKEDLPIREMLLLGEGHCLREQVLEVCPDCVNVQEGKVAGGSIETLRHMIASGLGVTVLPSTATHIAYYKSTLCTRPFRSRVPQRRVALAWRMSYTRTKSIDALIQALYQMNVRDICLLPE